MIHKGWIIYRQKDAIENKNYIDWFIEEARLQHLSLTLVLREDLTIRMVNDQPTLHIHGKQVPYPPFAIVRTVEPVLHIHLERCGIRTFNSAKVSQLCNHKSLTHLEMSQLNMPMVDTIFTQKDLLTHTLPMPVPFVVKESTGRSGKQVYFIQSTKDWVACIDQLTTNDLVVQSTNVQIGKDVRVFIVGKEIVGAVLRESKTDFRANFKLGGTATWYPLNDKERALIHTIIHHIDFDMVGIDFLIGPTGDFLLNEIEDVVGSRILSATSDINIVRKYVTHINEQMKYRN